MSDRGEYRGIPRVLLDSREFQLLAPEDRHVLLTMKIAAGPTGIDVQYSSAIRAELAETTGLSPEAVGVSLDRLDRAGWIEREANVLWIVDQLRDDPALRPTNDKHRKGVLSHLKGLPALAIVRRFVGRYAAWFDDPERLSMALPVPALEPENTRTDNGSNTEDPAHGNGEAGPGDSHREAIPQPRDSLSDGYIAPEKSAGSREREREREKGKVEVVVAAEKPAATTATTARWTDDCAKAVNLLRAKLPEYAHAAMAKAVGHAGNPFAMATDLLGHLSTLNEPTVTPEQMARALRDADKNGKLEQPNSRQVRRYLRDAIAEESEVPRSGDGLDWAARREREEAASATT